MCHLGLALPIQRALIGCIIEKYRECLLQVWLDPAAQRCQGLGSLQPSDPPSAALAPSSTIWLHMEVPQKHQALPGQQMAALNPNLTFSHHANSFSDRGKVLSRKPQQMVPDVSLGTGRTEALKGLRQSGLTGAVFGSVSTHRSRLRLTERWL